MGLILVAGANTEAVVYYGRTEHDGPEIKLAKLHGALVTFRFPAAAAAARATY
jgi:hypothetical protein